MERFSRKRQAVLDCLCGTTSHPTADWIYSQLKPLYHDLSLATVYRNLSQLKDAGLVRSVGIIDGQEHYDATVSQHPHVLCRSCGAIVDINGMDIPPELTAAAESASGFKISDAALLFSGICEKCADKQEN